MYAEVVCCAGNEKGGGWESLKKDVVVGEVRSGEGSMFQVPSIVGRKEGANDSLHVLVDERLSRVFQ